MKGFAGGFIYGGIDEAGPESAVTLPDKQNLFYSVHLFYG